jgi:FtsZ-binding cell division protein ZapB
MSEPLSEKTGTLLDSFSRLRDETERLRNESKRLFTESEHLRAASEQLRDGSDRACAAYEWWRERVNTTRISVGAGIRPGIRR